MRAVIHQVAGRQGVSALPVAGRALIVRQVQWLRAIGCERIALEIDSHPSTERIVEWLAEDGCGIFVDVVLTARPMGAREIARRAGVPLSTPFLAIPADVLGGGDPTKLAAHGECEGIDIDLSPPAALSRGRSARIALYGRIHGKRRTMRGLGWGAHVTTFRDAHELGLAALEGTLGGEGTVFELPIHAAELRPGVWVGRGADVSPDAELVAPVLVGAGACVAAGARVGPRAVIADHAVIEADAVVEDAYVGASTVVEDARVVRDTNFTARGVRALTIPPCTSLVPGASALAASPPGIEERLLAAIVVVLLAPLAAVAAAGKLASGRRLRTGIVALVASLAAVVAGRLRLFGVGQLAGDILGASPALLRDAGAAPAGAIDVEAALSEPDADAMDKLRARAWYAASKTFATDITLVRRAIRARFASGARSAPRPSPASVAPRRMA